MDPCIQGILCKKGTQIQFISRTPLHYAAQYEYAEIIKLLMEFGASPFIWSIHPFGTLARFTYKKSLTPECEYVAPVLNKFLS